MAAATVTTTTKTGTSTSTFPLFSNLAFELRSQIWREALPSEFSPTLYFYNEELWQARIVFPESDPESCDDELNDDFIAEDLRTNYRFCHELLDYSQISTPLIFVNREARDIVLGWARRHGIKICQKTPYPILARPFDPESDILYVPYDESRILFHYPYNIYSYFDTVNLAHGKWNEVTRLALREDLLERDPDYIRGMYFNFINLKVLYIIIDTRSDMEKTCHPPVPSVQSQWECREAPCGAFVWNDEKKIFEGKGSKDSRNDHLYDVMTAVGRELRFDIMDNRCSIFEIRPVFAVKRI
ncbi:hypothetical protein NHQ30_011027 [Ciborinia camelliae]|nr:hypothetical protein NHQ30_011027 [Ciborinia camelliae]